MRAKKLIQKKQEKVNKNTKEVAFTNNSNNFNITINNEITQINHINVEVKNKSEKKDLIAIKNRISAQKSRDKKKQEFNEVKDFADKLIEENKKLLEELSKRDLQIATLSEQLRCCKPTIEDLRCCKPTIENLRCSKPTIENLRYGTPTIEDLRYGITAIEDSRYGITSKEDSRYGITDLRYSNPVDNPIESDGYSTNSGNGLFIKSNSSDFSLTNLAETNSFNSFFGMSSPKKYMMYTGFFVIVCVICAFYLPNLQGTFETGYASYNYYILGVNENKDYSQSKRVLNLNKTYVNENTTILGNEFNKSMLGLNESFDSWNLEYTLPKTPSTTFSFLDTNKIDHVTNLTYNPSNTHYYPKPKPDYYQIPTPNSETNPITNLNTQYSVNLLANTNNIETNLDFITFSNTILAIHHNPDKNINLNNFRHGFSDISKSINQHVEAKNALVPWPMKQQHFDKLDEIKCLNEVYFVRTSPVVLVLAFHLH